jgi:hypothetical protein
MAELAQAAEEGDEKKFIFSRNDTELMKPPQDFLRSTQTSSAFDLLLQKNNQQIASVHRTVKITHRPQLVNHKRSNLSGNLNPVLLDLHDHDNRNTCDTGRKNWSDVIQNLKQHVTVTSKHAFASKLGETAPETPERTPPQPLPLTGKVTVSRGQTPSEKNRKSQTEPREQQGLSSKLFPYFTYHLEQVGPGKQKAKAVLLSSHEFRRLRKEFDEGCLVR